MSFTFPRITILHQWKHWQIVAKCLRQYEINENQNEKEEDIFYDTINQIKARLQKNVFHCYLIAGKYNLSIGKLQKVIDLIIDGFLGKNGGFTIFSNNWQNKHHNEEYSLGLQLIGDTLIEMSKRCIKSKHSKPNDKGNEPYIVTPKSCRYRH